PGYWLKRTVWVFCGATLALLAVAMAQPAQLWPLLIPLFISPASLSCVLPNATACAMAGQGAHAGSASALIGSLQFCVAAVASTLVGSLHDGTARPMALIIAVCGVVTVILALLTARHERRRALEF
ncbi:MAG TPA: Bcr/CflA family drug resistance efflux transporter, partial [Pseudomonas sp.]|nr:Bcr/CflA family drug resistance efflux transporter [Pseudomonas sp.]